MSLAALYHDRHAGNAERDGGSYTAPTTLALILALMVQSAILIRCRHRRSGHVHILGRAHADVIENLAPRVSELVR